MSVAAGVWVRLAPGVNAGALKIHSAPADPSAAASLSGQPVETLAAPQQLSASTENDLPAGTRLEFEVTSPPAAAKYAFLASFDPATKKWTPTPSQYDPTTHVISAVVTHFSVWSPLAWITDEVKALLTGALNSVFGVFVPAKPLACDSSSRFNLKDSVVNGAVDTCVEAASATVARVRIVNTRRYAVDLVYRDGDQVTVSDTGSVAAQIGGAITPLLIKLPGVSRVLLPPKAGATILIPLTAGASAEIGTEIDGGAFLMSVLDAGLSEIALTYDKLAEITLRKATPDVGTLTINNLLKEIGVGKCLTRVTTELNSTDPLSLSAVRTFGSVGFDCLQAAVSELAVAALTSIVGVVVGLIDALLQSIWGLVDSVQGQSRHLFSITAKANTADAPWTDGHDLIMTSHGIGAVKVGMTANQAIAAAGTAIAKNVHGSCALYGPGTDGVSEPQFLIESGGTVEELIVDGGTIRKGLAPRVVTTAGIRVGSTKAAVLAAYPTAKVAVDTYHSTVITVDTGDGTGMRFDVSEGSTTVSTMQAGATASIAHAEICA